MKPSPIAGPPEPTASASTAPPARADEVMLEGPHSRLDELFTLFRVMADFLRGFRVLHFVGPCVTVFGSARTKAGSPDYELARKMGAGIARLGFTVMTGGGPGIMEAANRGAKEAGGCSVGCNIKLPFEQVPNEYLDRSVTLYYFFVRKTLLVKYSYAFVVMPGGRRHARRIFEALTLIQTGKIQNFPIVIMGTDYWRELTDLLNKMARLGMINPADVDLVYVTDSVEEALEHIRAKAIEPFGLKRVVRRSFPWLGERGLRAATLMKRKAGGWGSQRLAAFPNDRRYLIGVSGGRDSVALLHWLLSQGYRKLIVCHFEHGLRGRAGKSDARFVERLAKKYGLNFELGSADIAALAARTKQSIETTARNERLAFFERVGRRRRCLTIFLAHQADDQVETFLLNLFRGAGGRGLGAMRLSSNHGSLEIVRPLLGVWRSEIDHYVKSTG